MSFLKRLFSVQSLVSIGIILGSIFLAYLMIVSKPSVEKTPSESRKTLVDSILVESGDSQVIVSAYGTVEANRDTQVFAQVGGRVIQQSSDLVIGGLIQENQVMVKIDPTDYNIAIAQTRAMVEKGEFDLKVEEGRQIVAKREWELLNPSIQSTDIGRSLALREPHLKEKKAALAGAQSQLEKAEVDLSRTIIRAPFSSIVTEETVEVGDLLTPQTRIARLVATDAFRVKVSIPFEQLKWITVPKGKEVGSPVSVIQEVGGGVNFVKTGKVVRFLGDVDPQGRMVRLLVTIKDPLGLSLDEQTTLPLLLGTYVRVDIHGPILKDVFVIPREAMRGNSNVWIKTDEDTLAIRKVNVIFREEDSVIVDSGLEDGDAIIVSNLTTPIPGMALQELFSEDDDQ